MADETNRNGIEAAPQDYGRMVRMPPKHHDEMKLGKPRGKRVKKTAKKQKD